MKVLVCAYSCLKDPDKRFEDGGESFLGWNIILQLSRFNQVWILTHSQNQAAIEERTSKSPISNAKFCYINLSSLDFLRNIHGGVQIYTYLWQIKAYFVAKKLNKKIHFDVFHHATYANDWMASYIGALLPVYYIRGPGGGAHRVPKNFVKKYSFRDRLAEKTRSIGQWIFRHDPFFILGQNKAKAILVCNKESFNAMPVKWQKKAYFFPVNGISSNDFLFLKSIEKSQSDDFLILSAGKLIKIKGFDLAIKAFKIFSEKISNAKLIIVGEGPESENLKKLTREINLSGKVVFEGWLTREKLFQKMIDCDIFLFPSLRDGGGNVVVEAMAAGRPVVCFNEAGPGFHIDEKCGIKIKAENPKQAIKDISDALEKLYFNKELREKLGVGAEKKAKREYDWDKLGDKLSEIYKIFYD